MTSACPGTSDIFVTSLARRIAAASMDAAGPMASACVMRDGPGIVATNARRGDMERTVIYNAISRFARAIHLVTEMEHVDAILVSLGIRAKHAK